MSPVATRGGGRAVAPRQKKLTADEAVDDGITVENADVMKLYEAWEPPVVIISDGAYGVAGFPGDPPTADKLGEWYEPHIREWSKRATPMTTLWFWNTELGWANVHRVLERYGWKFRACCIWDKGMKHAAGNTNTQSLRKFPVVTEVCVQYVKEAEFAINGRRASMQEWLRHEWTRAGLPLYKANAACGVANAATRKYLTADHLWYYPPPEMFERLAAYAQKHGRPEGRPYFSVDGKAPIPADLWARMRAKFTCPVGVTNVWSEPPLNGEERFKDGAKCIHLNQKPLKLLERIIVASSDPGDVVWEPFGGLCSAAIASLRTGRKCRSAEVLTEYARLALQRLEDERHAYKESRSSATRGKPTSNGQGHARGSLTTLPRWNGATGKLAAD